MHIFEHVSIVFALCGLEEILNKFKLVNTILVFVFLGNTWGKKSSKKVLNIYMQTSVHNCGKDLFTNIRTIKLKKYFNLATLVITWERISQLIKMERMTERDIQLQNACVYVCVNVYPHTAWGYLPSWDVDKHEASTTAKALKIPRAEDYIAHMPLKLSTLLNHECTCSSTNALWIYWHMLELWDTNMKKEKKNSLNGWMCNALD